MEESRHRFPAMVLEIPRGDATVARGHGERRRPRRGEPAGAAEQPEAGGFQPRRRDADDLSDLEPSRVLRLRSGEGPRGRSGDGVPESHPAEISAQAHDRVGQAQISRGQERVTPGNGFVWPRTFVPLSRGMPTLVHSPRRTVSTTEYCAPCGIRTLFFRCTESTVWVPKSSVRWASRIPRTRSRFSPPFTRASVTCAFQARRSRGKPSRSREASSESATRAIGSAPSTPTQITFIRPRLGNAPVPRTRIRNGRRLAVASRIAVTISGTSPSWVSPCNLTVGWSWSVPTTFRDGLVVLRSFASASRTRPPGTSTAMNPRNVIAPPAFVGRAGLPARTDPPIRTSRRDSPPRPPSGESDSRRPAAPGVHPPNPGFGSHRGSARRQLYARARDHGTADAANIRGSRDQVPRRRPRTATMPRPRESVGVRLRRPQGSRWRGRARGRRPRAARTKSAGSRGASAHSSVTRVPWNGSPRSAARKARRSRPWTTLRGVRSRATTRAAIGSKTTLGPAVRCPLPESVTRSPNLIRGTRRAPGSFLGSALYTPSTEVAFTIRWAPTNRARDAATRSVVCPGRVPPMTTIGYRLASFEAAA